MDKLKSKIEGWKNFTEQLLKDNKRLFIKDLNNDFYFADVLLVGDETLMIQCFAPESRVGRKFTLYWAQIERIEEYKEVEKNGV